MVALVGGPFSGERHTIVPWAETFAIHVLVDDVMNQWHDGDVGHYPLRLLTFPPFATAIYGRTARRNAAGLLEFVYRTTEYRRSCV